MGLYSFGGRACREGEPVQMVQTWLYWGGESALSQVDMGLLPRYGVAM